eukprot:SAG31_NODE_1948_length_6834_cov_16.124276_9_plen_120_part_00
MYYSSSTTTQNPNFMPVANNPMAPTLGNGVICFNCNQPGHMSRQCPQRSMQLDVDVVDDATTSDAAAMCTNSRPTPVSTTLHTSLQLHYLVSVRHCSRQSHRSTLFHHLTHALENYSSL